MIRPIIVAIGDQKYVNHKINTEKVNTHIRCRSTLE